MEREVVYIHAIDQNIGDRMSCPQRVLNRSGVSLNARSPKLMRNLTKMNPDTLCILGGGGMFDRFEQMWATALEHFHRVVIWGVGMNQHAVTNMDWPLNYFERPNVKLSGLRDIQVKGNPKPSMHYVPCASCVDLHWLMKHKPYPVECYETMVYQHYDRPLRRRSDMVMQNNHPNMSEVVWRMMDANKVVTNTYHGLYWARLLKKDTELTDTWSNKFLGLEEHPQLEEHVDLNLKFAALVRGLI